MPADDPGPANSRLGPTNGLVGVEHSVHISRCLFLVDRAKSVIQVSRSVVEWCMNT